MMRKLFAFVALLSLVLCVASVALAVRSYSWEDDLELVRMSSPTVVHPRGRIEWRMSSGNGRVWMSRYYSEDTNPFLILFQDPPGLTHHQFHDLQYGWKDDSPFNHWIRFARNRGGFEVEYPIFTVTGITLVLPLGFTVKRFGLRRSRSRGHCPGCSYNLTGNTSGTCPECGAACKAANSAGVSPTAGVRDLSAAGALTGDPLPYRKTAGEGTRGTSEGQEGALQRATKLR